jgi:hypothetical protein
LDGAKFPIEEERHLDWVGREVMLEIRRKMNSGERHLRSTSHTEKLLNW